MGNVTTLFFDVGGVLLTNGWDRSTRREAAAKFGLNWDELEERHELVVAVFENGQIGLEEYLDHTVFHSSRPFSRDDFKSFLYAQSRPFPESLALVAELARSGKYLMATLNNESRELNIYRISQFRLCDYFTAFLTSCFLGARKPDERIYRLALDITQRGREECLFVDDRAINVEAARRQGMRAVQFKNATQLRHELGGVGVS